MIINLFVSIIFLSLGYDTRIFATFSWLVLSLIIITWIAAQIELGKARAFMRGYWTGINKAMEEYDERVTKMEEAVEKKTKKKPKARSRKIPRRKTTSKRIRR
jgi:hypothetical protein